MNNKTNNNSIPSNEQNLESVSSSSFFNITRVRKFFQNRFTIVVILIIAVVGLVSYKQLGISKQQVKTITIKKQVLFRRSKTPGLISRGITGKAIDVNTGKIVIAARIFTLNDNTVYLELDLQNPPKGTLIDYIRYKEGRYVDHGEITVQRIDTKDVLFNWTINKLLAGVTNGNWKIATYTNGILAKRFLYKITDNKVSYIYPEQKILTLDPDYQLAKSLTSTNENQ